MLVSSGWKKASKILKHVWLCVFDIFLFNYDFILFGYKIKQNFIYKLHH